MAKGGITVSAEQRRIRGVHSDIDNVTIKGDKWKTRIGNNVLDAWLVRSIEGASTVEITIHDPHLTVLAATELEDRLDIEIDGLWFRLAAIDKTGDNVLLTFEDREVSYLRQYDEPRKANRDSTTRAEFVLSLIREVKEEDIAVFIPELHVEQPVADSSDSKDKDKKREDKRDKGMGKDNKKGGGKKDDKGTKSKVADSSEKNKKDEEGKGSSRNITVKGATATSTQIKIIEKILDACSNASKRIKIAAIMTATQESNMSNLTGHGGIDIGVYSQNPDGWPASRDIAKDTGAFVSAAKRADNGQSLNDLCQDVQRSGFPNAYGQWEKEATRTVNVYEGGSSGDVEETERQTKVKTKKYQFKRGGENGEREDSWDCIGRLAAEVRWRGFMAAGIFYYVSEKWLYRQESWAVIEKDTKGIDEVDFNFDFGKSISEVQLRGRITEWAAPPGVLIELGDDYGPASGRYLIAEIRTSLLGEEFEATCKKPMKPLPEPAPETVERTSKKGDGGGKVGKTQGGKLSTHPTGGKGSIIGTPNSGTHTLGNWQSDNAVDIDCPVGTPIHAVESGTISGTGFTPGGGRFAGGKLTLNGGGNSFFYTHLSKLDVKDGDHVEAGQIIGKSGSANGVAHLHFASQNGDPRDYL